MKRSVPVFAAAVLVGFTVGKADDSRKPDMAKLEKDLVRLRSSPDAATRKTYLDAYPLVSLEDRLAFDRKARERVNAAFPTPELDLKKWKPLYYSDQKKIPAAALATLQVEQRLDREDHFDRAQALAVLHQVEVRKFVTNPGFGMSRLLVPRPSNSREEQPKGWSEGDRGEFAELPQSGTFFTAGKDKDSPTLPSVLALSGFHTSTTHEFAHPDSWGLVKDVKHVAGFLPHTLQGTPDIRPRSRYDQANPVKNKEGGIISYPLVERWAVRKVELIGLLVHDAPVVYLNPENTLPTMADAGKFKTRELSHFESSSLKDLAAGKTIVAVDATVNQVRMVGAIRMAEACLKCHEGKRGDLLGAFSYDLVRDPIYTAPQK